MKRLFAALALCLALTSLAQAKAPTRQHKSQYARLYRKVVRAFGQRAPGRNIIRDGLSTGRAASNSDVTRSIGVLSRMLAPPPALTPAATTTLAPAASPSSTSSPGGLSSVPGVPSTFAACVAMRESTNGAGSSDIYGILPSNGYYPGMSLAAQQALFAQMYAASGTSPWAPYDGC